jgi:NAD(P)-dependent dehydrogenase (short-subunit alcohol dehydrogenase family)
MPTPAPTVQQLFDLTGRVAVVTGAAGYLGRALSRALAEAGARVVCTSREAGRAVDAAATLPGSGHLGVALDHTDPASLDRGWAQIVERTGHVDVLVNNGHEANASDWTTVTAGEFTRQLSNATGYFLLARHLREHAVRRGSPASIIMLGSMYGLVGSYPDAYEGVAPASPVAYHTLKGGILHMTRHLAVYWARDRVRVNCLSPGPFPSEKAPAVMVERLKTKCPMARTGEPHELKGAAVFLASDASSYMTGQNVVIDGGWTAW